MRLREKERKDVLNDALRDQRHFPFFFCDTGARDRGLQLGATQQQLQVASLMKAKDKEHLLGVRTGQ